MIKVDLETHSHGTFPVQSWQERLLCPLWDIEEREKADCCHVCSLMWINILSGRTKLIHEGKVGKRTEGLMTLEPTVLQEIQSFQSLVQQSFF